MSKRLLRVNELLKQELGTYIGKEFEFQGILVSVHAVDVAPNLRKADVFVGVIGDDASARKAIEKLNHNRVEMQSYISKRVTMRYTPRLEFHADDSVERGVKIMSLLDQIAEEPKASPAPGEDLPEVGDGEAGLETRD